MERSRGIAVFQLFGRLAGFFTTFVNPIGLRNITWKWLIVYVAWLTYEVVFVWFLFPETANRTLEELAFCESILPFVFFSFGILRGRGLGKGDMVCESRLTRGSVRGRREGDYSVRSGGEGRCYARGEYTCRREEGLSGYEITVGIRKYLRCVHRGKWTFFIIESCGGWMIFMTWTEFAKNIFLDYFDSEISRMPAM